MEPVGHEAEAAKQEGNDFFRQKQYTKAVAKFSESLQHKPTDPFVLGNRAAALLALGRAEDALADAKEAIRLDPNYVKGYYRCTSALLALGRNSSAVTAASTGLKLQPTNAQLQALLEQANEAKRREEPMYGDGDDDDDDEGEYDDTDGEGEEEETDEDMDDDDDDDDEAWASLKNPADMEVEGGGGRPRPPASRVSVIDALDPDGAADAKAEAMKDAGNAEYKQGKYGTAADYYSKAIALAPENATYWTNRAAARLMTNDGDEALSDAQKAISLQPTLLKAHVRAVKALCLLGRLSDARRQFEALIAQPGGDAHAAEGQAISELETLYRQGKSALEREGQDPAREALQTLNVLAEKCPSSIAFACLQMEAVIRARPGHGASQVMAESSRWIRKHSDHPDLLCVRGKALYGTGQIEQASDTRPRRTAPHRRRTPPRAAAPSRPLRSPPLAPLAFAGAQALRRGVAPRPRPRREPADARAPQGVRIAQKGRERRLRVRAVRRGDREVHCGDGPRPVERRRLPHTVHQPRHRQVPREGLPRRDRRLRRGARHPAAPLQGADAPRGVPDGDGGVAEGDRRLREREGG